MPMTAFSELQENSVVTYADDTAVIVHIAKQNESSHWGENNDLTEWCAENNLVPNVSKTEEQIADFRKRNDTPLGENEKGEKKGGD